MSKLAILIVGYNRPGNLKRLLQSLDDADYQGDNVDLLISIDKSGDDSVERVASKHIWIHGKKKVYTYPKRMGLKNHIIHCGTFLNEYDAIAILEDDLYVSPAFYNYMKQTVAIYKDDNNIAGISLYTHLWNPNPQVNFPFEPADSMYDVFFMQYAQSWGQVWMKKQWQDFIQWYDDNSGEIPIDDDFPIYVSKWNNSWLKYHIKYCVEKNKYFVYPYKSLTTCFTDVGAHNILGGNAYQVALCKKCRKQLVLPKFDVSDAVYYDVFFERQRIGFAVDINDNELIVDLYGVKKINAKRYKYLLTMNTYPYSIIKQFGLHMRPHEENIIYNIPGNDLFLYKLDGRVIEHNKQSATVKRYIYYHRIHGNTSILSNVWKQKMFEYLKIKKLKL